MGVRSKANWHLTEPSSHQAAVDVEAMGTEIDLRSPEELEARLQSLLRREGRLASIGLSCDLKWTGQSCATCPYSAGLDEARGAVCNIGHEQERIAKGLMRPLGEFDALAEAASIPELVALAEACAA